MWWFIQFLLHISSDNSKQSNDKYLIKAWMTSTPDALDRGLTTNFRNTVGTVFNRWRSFPVHVWMFWWQDPNVSTYLLQKSCAHAQTHSTSRRSLPSAAPDHLPPPQLLLSAGWEGRQALHCVSMFCYNLHCVKLKWKRCSRLITLTAFCLWNDHCESHL